MDADAITEAALAVLDEVGVDGLTMRQVAARLGVHVGGLYYHVPDKAALLRAMGDAICAEVLASFDGADAAALCACVRTGLLARRDAARVLLAAPLNGSVEALELMERLITLLEPAVGRAAGAAADALMSYLTGFVLQEQAGDPVAFPLTLDELRDRFPRVLASAASAEEDNFAAAVDAIIDGFGARSRVSPTR